MDEPHVTHHLAAGVGLCTPPKLGERWVPPRSPQGWDAHRPPGSHPTETQGGGGAAPGALPFLHPLGRPQLEIALWLGRTRAGWGREGAGSVPSAQGCVSPSSMGTPGQGAQLASHPIPPHPSPHRYNPGLLEGSYHWGWLAPGDNIRSQWGAAGFTGGILPLPSAAAVPGPSV